MKKLNELLARDGISDLAKQILTNAPEAVLQTEARDYNEGERWQEEHEVYYKVQIDGKDVEMAVDVTITFEGRGDSGDYWNPPSGDIIMRRVDVDTLWEPQDLYPFEYEGFEDITALDLEQVINESINH